ncbi:MAG: PKD domain-containing protein [Bacteroidetes bacterium]|nr:PKD domain-containing protein [Bacteroidota bacterium]
MKKRTPYYLLLAILWFLGQNSLFAQPGQGATIVGPTTLCVGECGVYEVVLNDSTMTIETVTWLSGAGTTTSGGNPIDFCPTFPINPPVTLTASGFGFSSNGNLIQFSASIQINLSTSLDPVIVPTIAACPQDSSSQYACEKICAFGTAVYEVTGIPPTTPVTWSVQGAESFTPNGNSVLVEWGAPGQGQVSVVAGGGSSPPNGPFQLFCTQISLVTPNQPGVVYLNMFGGTPPYFMSYTMTGGPSGAITNIFSNPIILNPTLPGTYTYTVTDANGQTAICSLNVVGSSQDCWVSAYPTSITHPSNDLNCDGKILMTGAGGQPPYTYQWSNGATTPTIDFLCCGSYTVTVVDAIGCTATVPVILACPDSTSTCSGETSLCVEILEEPEAQIGSLPPPQPNGTIAICQGQTIYFQNSSLNATSYVWDFGNLNTSTQFEPSQIYNVPGSYIVSLIARNECYCSDTTFVEVYVIAADVPEINCTGTICEGETVTYSTDANCGTYTWALTGSYNILDGGTPTDNFITVEWLAGPEGTISLSVSGCAGTVCTLPNVVPIPIVSDNVQIQGPDKVCEGSTEQYFIPDYAGTSILWTVLGSGTITDGQGTERITVNWFGSANLGNPQRVIVEFDNCYLGCSGKDTLNVNIVPGFYTTGPIEVCASASGTYQSRNTITDALMLSNWQVINSLGVVIWSSGAATSTANVPFNFPAGAYTVRATAASASGFCNDDYDIFVKLVAAPPAPTAIIGEDEICPGTAYSYEATGLPTTDFTWTVTGGAPASFFGNPATVTWNAAGPYSLSVVQTATTGLACTSPPATLAVTPIPSFTVTGDGQVCREATETYSAPFFENIDYQWVISPATAGTVVSGTGTESVDVLWHTDGPATVGVTVCGATQNYNVTVLPLPEPVVPPTQVCAGEMGTVQTTVPFASYGWNNASGAQISTAAMPMLGVGNYEVEVNDANGCVGDTIFEVSSLPLPNASISTPAYFALCAGGPGATLHATQGSPAYSYQWQRFGVNVGANSPAYLTMQPGDYQVIVTDANGCTAASNILTLVDCAAIGGTCVGGQCFGGAGGGPPLPGCTPGGTVNFTTATTANCNTLSFTNISTNFVPGTFTWLFGDGGTSNADNPAPHAYPTAGWYTVVLIGEVNAISPPGGSCFVGIYHDVLIPLGADFEVASACPGAPAQFTDRSVFIAPASITGWAWNFGDPGSGAANTSTLQNPTHIFATSGSYNVTLTITGSSGCTVSRTLPVTVLVPPAVSFSLPSATCENTSLPFDAVVGNEVASVYWNFGDPTSGDGNNSELISSHHEFDLPGSYAVQLTALSIEGCTNVFTDNMTITPNTLAGDITTAPPSPLCEGESTTLTSPPDGISWIWSNNSPINNITISESGVYSVTLTDATGCTYAPPPAVVEVFGEPNGIIKAVEYNEFGQPVAFFENNHNVCEGDDVTLLVQGSLTNSYTWSNGETSDEIEFTEDKGNLLPVGTHNFTVTVTDNATGCTSTEGPFTVTVNPVPTVTIASVPSGFICENTSATLNVVGPDPMLTYNWNTGESGTSITVIAGGTYFAQAINQFGCSGQSNEIEIQNAPDIDLIPQGCHSRCQPDTMCLPNVPNVASFQWYWNGGPMSAPNGTLAEPVFNQSGEYYVVMTDVFGCTSTSDVLTLDLFPGFGDILGDVYFDVNQNGIIDAPDTLVGGINIFLNDGSSNLDTVTSNAGTGYIFVDILSTNYTLLLDTLNLPPGWQAVLVSTNLDLTGCDVEEQFDWLLFLNCVPSTSAVQLSACPGSSANYNGTPVPTGTSQDFTLTNYLGCDSVVTVTVTPLATSTGSETLDACPGTSATYNGTQVATGSSQNFTLTNWLGCDSVVTVTVNPLPAPTSSVALMACPGGFAIYNGQQLATGSTTDFLFPSSQNCDSVVTVTVAPLPTSASSVTLTACPGSFAVYNGTQVATGASQNFTLTNWLGCDSVVTVTVAPLPAPTSTVALTACLGDFADYNGTPLPPGSVTDFLFPSSQNCDSVVTVTVTALPVSASALGLQTCPGSTVSYNGQPLAPGDVQSFTFTNWLGCDSVVTVSVTPFQTLTLVVDAVACEGEFFVYNGVQIPAGSQQIFTTVNADGCMDTTIVGVGVLLPSASSLNLTACGNTFVTYGGQQLFPGDVQDFTLTNALGCDSVVTVTVTGIPLDTTEIALVACPNSTVSYGGQNLAAGDVVYFTFTDQNGCDSVVQVSVTASPSLGFGATSATICADSTNGYVQFGNLSGGVPPYQFSVDGQTFQPGDLVENLPGGNYTAWVQDANGCLFSQPTEVPVFAPLLVQAPDQTIACGDSLRVTFSVAQHILPYTWQWQDGSTGPGFWVETPGTYTVTVSNDCETVERAIEVKLEEDPPLAQIYLPNSFSPNDDGFNDCYRGYIDPEVELVTYELKIFDRWGNQMFGTTDIEGCWDGWFKGKEMDTAVFVYWMKMQVRDCDGELVELFKEGGVHLVR